MVLLTQSKSRDCRYTVCKNDSADKIKIQQLKLKSSGVFRLANTSGQSEKSALSIFQKRFQITVNQLWLLNANGMPCLLNRF